MSHRPSGACRSIACPARDFGGGAMRYQPTSASAALWRSFILLFFEARVIARDTVRSGEDASEVVSEPLRKIWRRILQHSGVYIGPSLLTVIGRMVRLVDRPFRESGRL